MIIVPTFCAQSYAYNGRVEKKVGAYLASITGLEASNFGEGARPEFDFMLGDTLGAVQIELKTTSSKYIPVETHKDQARTIEAGLMSSTSPIVVTLSMGTRSGFGAVGKLRAWSRKSLLQQAGKHGLGKFYPAANQSEGSFSYSFVPGMDSFHIWLGDVPVVYQKNGPGAEDFVLGYDLDSIFDDDRTRAAQLLEMVNKFRGINEE